MVKTGNKTAANQMRREYGETFCEACYACCNRQWNNVKEQKMVCIAFGGDLAWDGSEKACGLFNVPFRGIRPYRLPLSDYLEKSVRQNHPSAVCENQSSLFLQPD